MEYNTTRTDLILREYGRNFHKLVDHINGVKEKEKRNELSKTLVDMMKVTHPSLGDQSELEAKLWDDLYIMSDYSLDIDSPYPKPAKKLKSDASDRLHYPKSKIRYRHYGKKIELLIEEACKLKKEEDREAAVIHIGKIMKSFFGMWNKESIDNKVIVENIKELSNNKLTIDIEKVKELNLFHKVTRERGSKSYHSKKHHHKSGHHKSGHHKSNHYKSNRPFRKKRMQ
ncbi:MAG: hypothetical protein CMB83_01700 [Flammeovirgaceae bacterium]|nr:hypothetical protein [Marinoscillum sp.]MAR64634.1 hypothetical protein [Flammeovirgaceae bacterium]PDH45738.1 MAG: hypothetical protein CNE34_00835 [Rhodothermaeota bacterium MED-G18]|tara:strand:+ start:2868 stop:3551 length:684 start_codon:yes stop_codon:yes gene_type:complete